MTSRDLSTEIKFRWTNREERLALIRSMLEATQHPGEIGDWIAAMCRYLRQHRKVDEESVLEVAAAARETFGSFAIPLDGMGRGEP